MICDFDLDKKNRDHCQHCSSAFRQKGQRSRSHRGPLHFTTRCYALRNTSTMHNV